MKRFCILIMCLTLSQFVVAQYFNGLNNLCVSYTSNTSINLNWDEITSNTSDFQSYKIYVKQGNGAYQLLTEITDYTISSYNYVFPLVDNYEFYIEAVSNDNSIAEYSDKKQVFYLELLNKRGIAFLSWTVFDDVVNKNNVFIYKRIDSGLWESIDTVSIDSLTYNDTINIKECSAFIEYKLVVEDNSCLSESNIVSDVFEDKTEPYSPILKVVTVDSITGYTKVIWYPSGSDDTKGYLIRKRDSLGNINEPDEVIGRLDTVYVYPDTRSKVESNTFEVSAFDYCMNNSSPINEQQNIFLQNSVLACDKIIELSWNRYINWEYGVKEYNILQSVNNGPFNLLASLDSSSFNYSVENIDIDNNYRFLISAISGDNIESLSNITIPTIIYPETPLGLYISSASVSEDNLSIQLNIARTPDGDYNGIKIYKENQFGNFYLLDEIDDNTTLQYTDYLFEQNNEVMRYFVSYIDGCENEGDSSNIVSTIYAETNTLNDVLEANVIWTNYVGAQNGVISQAVLQRGQ